jgi:hypothetical protein
MIFHYQEAHSVGSPYTAGFNVVLVPDNTATAELGLDRLFVLASFFSLQNFDTSALPIFLATILQCLDGFLGAWPLRMDRGNQT